MYVCMVICTIYAKNIVYSLLFTAVKNFHCFMSLPLFLKKNLWLPIFMSFHSIHMQKLAE